VSNATTVKEIMKREALSFGGNGAVGWPSANFQNFKWSQSQGSVRDSAVVGG
jgi:hypothetical protein